MVNEAQRGPSAALLLRAHVRWEGGETVTHTIELSETEVTVACDLPGDAEAEMTLSFPGLVEPFDLGVRVVTTRAPGGYGQPAASVCTITRAGDAARRALAGLVAMSGAPAPEPPPPESARDYRCLLVEDNAFIRDLFEYGVRRYSRSRGASVALQLAPDAEAAWRMLSHERFDVAIVDHFLPVQTGSQLIARIRAEPQLSQIPVVAISIGGSEARAEAMTAGADLFLDKPIVLRDLFSTLDKLTARVEAR